jgi:hypothetical protein
VKSEELKFFMGGNSAVSRRVPMHSYSNNLFRPYNYATPIFFLGNIGGERVMKPKNHSPSNNQ